MTFRFIHISDLHLPPLPAVGPRRILNKRLLGFLSWHRKRKHRHLPEVVTALERALDTSGADHICVTGDITNLGLAEEFRAADRWLHDLGARNTITFVPGNHDAYILESTVAMRDHFAAWLPESWPSMTRRDGVLFIGVSTAVPTPPTLATGRVGPEQLRRLDAILERTAGQGLYRVLLIHHPPAEDIVQRRKALTDAGALAAVLHARRVDLVIHGHGHVPVRYQLESGHGPIPVYGAGSASLAHHDLARTGHYQVFELDNGRLNVTHHYYRPDQERFVEARDH